MQKEDYAWQSPCPISKKDIGGNREFDKRVNEFKCYKCDNERGRGVKYFVEQSDNLPKIFRKKSLKNLVISNKITIFVP